MKTKQRGGTIIGLILGLIIGLGAALAVAVYVTKVPVPFLNKNAPARGEQEAAEAQRNKNWDPNAPLYGKNAARPATPPASSATTATGTVAPAPAPVPAPAPAVAVAPPAPSATPAAPTTSTPPVASASRTPASKPAAQAQSSDPLGDLAKARAAAAPDVKMPDAKAAAAGGADPFDYFVQAGAFRTQGDADAQRAKLAMLGWEARVSEREQSGRTVFRVRVGPFGKRDDAESLKGKLEGAGVESALVRVQR